MTDSAASMAVARRARLSDWLETVTAALLLFPLTIVTVAVAGFAAGISMSAAMLWVAAVVTFAGLRLFAGSWRAAVPLIAFVAAMHGAAGFLAAALPDSSWDGLAYQQEAVLRLAAGWNPLFEDANAYGRGNGLFINHYPKGAWIPSAAVLLSGAPIEAGKLFNFTLMLAAFNQSAAVLLRLTPLPIRMASGLAVLAALNPVSISQAPSFHVDGIVGSLLTVIVAAAAAHVVRPHWRPLAVVLLAAPLAINVKLTSLVYVAVLLALAVAIFAVRHGLRAARRTAVAIIAVGAAGALVLGYDPYVQNTLEHGHPAYPLFGHPQPVDVTGPLRPVNLNDKDRVQRFLISSFSRTEAVRAPGSTHLKFPLSFGPGELRGAYNTGMDAGGFGPLYGAMLLVAGAGGIALLVRPSTRRTGGATLLVGACVMASALVHSETSWARYVPQAWLLPILIAVAGFCSPHRSLRWWAGVSLVGLASANLFIVAGNISLQQLRYTLETRSALQQLRQAPQPVTVYLGPFRALRQRLIEAGIEFRVAETPPSGASRRHTIPAAGAPGEAYWLEEDTHVTR